MLRSRTRPMLRSRAMPTLRSRAVLAAVLAAMAAGGVAAAGPLTASAQGPAPAAAAVPAAVRLVPACGTSTGPGPLARCLAVVQATADGTPLATPAPRGYGPADLRSAYKTPLHGGGTHTVAIVDAFDNPNAEADLAVYRAQFGLPPCTTENGCFRKVDQRGGSQYPPPDSGWALEIALDLDMVSAVCPDCKLLLVESDDNGLDAMSAAVAEAAKLGATEISNSYGAVEFSGVDRYEAFYNQPGVAVVASSGDSAYGVQYPAASRYVTAVGGTTLARAGNSRGWSERAWDGAGSGCSAYVPKPAWQHDKLCSMRTVADVAAVADPVSGVALYDTFGGFGGWVVSGGTSAAAPIVAAVFALAGNAGSGVPASYPYRHPSGLFDVQGWINGYCGNYLCRSVRGYDGPTGLGTPNGTGGF